MSVANRAAPPVAGPGRGPWRARRPRHRLPYVSAGALLVVVCVLVYGYTAARWGDRVPVLAVARPVAAGQSIQATDLRQVSTADDPSLGLVPASQANWVVGRTAVAPLLPGTLLTRAMVGDAAYPPAGKVVASLSVKPGQYPQGLAAGAHVAVYVSAGTATGGQGASGATGSTGPAAPSRLSAVVLTVDLNGDGQGATVVTLLLDAADAESLAGAGSVMLMQTAPGGE